MIKKLLDVKNIPDRLLRPREVAEILAIGLTTLLHLCQEGRLVPVYIGRGRGVKRYTPDSVLAFIAGLENGFGKTSK